MSYFSWYWRGTKNLKQNWLVVWKMTWGIWQIFTRALESLKIGTLMGSFYPKLKMYEVKTCWGVMCHDNEEWWKSWRGIDFSVQNWHEEFNEFWPEHTKISQICTLIGCFWSKYIMFGLEKYRGVMFDGTDYWCKTWRKIGLCFQKKKTWTIWQIFTRALESLKIVTLMEFFYPKLKMYQLKICRGVMCCVNEE